MLFKIFTFDIGSLLPIVSVENDAAKEPINNDKSLENLDFKHKDTMANMLSPAPILSIAFFAKASENLKLFSFKL